MFRTFSWAFSLSLAAFAVRADVAYFETEPNDTPENFNHISGPVTLYGTMSGTDQDGYLWSVSDDDARKRWTFELQGIPGAGLTQVSVMQLEYAENGVDVTARRKLFAMDTRGGIRPSIHEGLIFEPGEYVLGFSQADSPGEDAGYRFFLRDESLKVFRNPKGGASLEDAHAIKAGKFYNTFETDEIAWYRFNFSEEDAASRWQISVQSPVGRKLEATLMDADGEKLISNKTDNKGRIAFKDLAPPVGAWFLQLEAQDPGMIQTVAIEVTGVPVDGQEAEPNDQRQLANVVDFSQPLTGRIGDGDPHDVFEFDTEETETPILHTLRLDSTTPKKIDFCLMNSEGKNVQCRSGTPPLIMPDLGLSPGKWGLHLKKSEAQNYTITLETQGSLDSGREVEPNDQSEYASGVPAKMRVKGRFSGDDKDHFQFMVTGEAQLWRFQANGTGITSLGYLDGRGKEKAATKASKGSKRVRLDNLYLSPGRHTIQIRGTDGEYTLLARALGPPVVISENQEATNAATPGTANDEPETPEAIWNPDGEVEPNDKSNMQRLAVGQIRTGTLPDTEDGDFYRFFVANHDHLKLTITPPEDGSIHPYLYWYGTMIGAADKREPGEVIEFQGILPPGDYYLAMGSDHPSDKPYQLTLERLPRFSCVKDCEPSGMGNLDYVSPTPPDLRLEGTAQSWRDEDVYELPAVDTDTELLIQTKQPFYRAKLSDGHGDSSSWLDYDDELGGYRIQLPAGSPRRLVITGKASSPYDAQLVFPQGEHTALTGELAMDMELALEAGEVAAFLDLGQQVEGEVVIRNRGETAVDLRLDVTTSDHRWTVALESNRQTIEAGGAFAVPLTVHVPTDAWADHDVRISVRARDEAGRHVESGSDIRVQRSTAAVNPRHYWPIPEILRGGFNAAWLPFGATVTEESPPKIQGEILRNDLVFPRQEVSCCRHKADIRFGAPWTLDLPGDEALPVAGVAIDFFGISTEANAIRHATLLLSEDGENFEEALRLEALPVLTEQYFPLSEPLPARFARLRIDATFASPQKEVAVGEWKVILQPGFDLSGGEGFNIADPDFGGHLVWTLPPDPGAGQILTDEDESEWANLGKSPSLEYVIGFKRDRAAQIERIDWRYHESASEDQRNFRSVSVSVSEHSPIGPWRSIGKIELGATDAGASLKLDEPTWARFVRLEVMLDPVKRRSMEPGTVEIWERPAADDYLSVLTEWGEGGGQAFYESQQALPQAAKLASGNDSRAAASPLTLGERTSGVVALGRQQNWFRLEVPDDVNMLRLELTGDPTVRTVLQLRDAAGNRLPIDEPRTGRAPNRHRYEAMVEPGQELWVTVLEPPRNVVFSWDTSGSVARYIPRIYNSVMAFSGEVQPEHEWVNLLPFGMPMLLSKWSDDPQVLQTVLNDYRQESDSSAAEASLFRAAKALGPRPGTKAVMLVTDAVTPYFGEMWKPMMEIQPRIFGVGVAGSGIEEQNRFRDWAAVNGGNYRQLRYLGEMDVAFDRASTKMHRPAAYMLLVEGEYREEPGPGQLSVVAGEAPPQAAVELILDASGSMLQRIEGKRRIVIAQEVLIEAVREHIPPGTPVALRVFGHKEVDSCRTDLEIPLGPLDPEAAAETIAGIKAMNLARTPIADSLAAVEKDLEGASSGVIVLVTDGEETCEGDPQAVIQSLQEKGFGVNLNIVGFAIDDANLADQFESWAQAGGGDYFAANDQIGLSDAIESALRIPFTVYDTDGNEVGAGQVEGATVELERGIYRVVVNSSPPRTFEDVKVIGDDQVQLELE